MRYRRAIPRRRGYRVSRRSTRRSYRPMRRRSSMRRPRANRYRSIGYRM